MTEHRKTWETYVASWKTTSSAERAALLEQSFAADCAYVDPLTQTRGGAELAKGIEEFQRQSPGVHFATIDFQSHHGRSLAHWEMRGADGEKLGDGVGYAEYDDAGKLTSVNNFFATP